LVCVEAGTGGALAAGLSAGSGVFAGGWLMPDAATAELEAKLAAQMAAAGAELGLGLLVNAEDGRLHLSGRLRLKSDNDGFDRPYGGPPANAAAWGVSLLLDMARRRLG